MNDNLGTLNDEPYHEDELEEPQSCPLCNNHPAFDEVTEGEFECRNCGTIQDIDGKIVKEGEVPVLDTNEDLWDDN